MGASGVSRSVLVTAVLAALVTAAALVTVVVLRPKPEDTALDAAAPGAPIASSDCGTSPCRVLASQEVHGTTVELLTDAEGGNGRFRSGGAKADAVVETMITALGVRLAPDSMRCVAGTVSACLLRGTSDGGTLGEVLVGRGDTWRAAEKPYFSDAGSIMLTNVSGDDSPEVVVLKHECSSGTTSRCAFTPIYGEVFDLTGRQLGCTRKYGSASQMNGWPDVRLKPADLRSCPTP